MRSKALFILLWILLVNCQTSGKTGSSDVALTWISVAGGSFDQGNPSPLEEMSDELPLRKVDLMAFEMLKTEVTVAQYEACVEASWCAEPEARVDSNWGDPAKSDHPLNYVNWTEAVAFCEWVEGRLPTESEWEYAARNQGEDLYPWGTEEADCTRAVMSNEMGDGCGTGTTMPVCSKPSGNSDLGLCDMIGNVWEWTLDWYHDSYVDAPVDGSAWVLPRGETRTMRGGAFSYDSFWNRSTSRDSHGHPSFQVSTLGFRCVRGVRVDADYDAPIVDVGVVGEYNDCDSLDCDFTCQSMECSNADGNTHTDCGCDADYCVPDEAGVQFAGLTPWTCTTAHCDPDEPTTCPEGTECKVIPAFVIETFADNGVFMPPTICGAP